MGVMIQSGRGRSMAKLSKAARAAALADVVGAEAERQRRLLVGMLSFLGIKTVPVARSAVPVKELVRESERRKYVCDIEYDPRSNTVTWHAHDVNMGAPCDNSEGSIPGSYALIVYCVSRVKEQWATHWRAQVLDTMVRSLTPNPDELWP